MEPNPERGNHVWKTDKQTDRRKCPAHNFWMKKGVCELCRMAADAKQRELEEMGGANKPPIVIGTSDKLNKENK